MLVKNEFPILLVHNAVAAAGLDGKYDIPETLNHNLTDIQTLEELTLLFSNVEDSQLIEPYMNWDMFLVGDDSLDAAFRDEQLSGGALDDYIFAGKGGDQVSGGDGNDILIGGNDSDSPAKIPNGLPVFDHYSGGDGADFIYTGLGEGGWVTGGNGNDLLVGGDGQDELAGGNGDDIIFGGAGDDNNGAGDLQGLVGKAGNDVIDGGTGDDILKGDSGNDLLRGNEGSDLLVGGSGSDIHVFTIDDIIEGDIDTISDLNLNQDFIAFVSFDESLHILDPVVEGRNTTLYIDTDNNVDNGVYTLVLESVQVDSIMQLPILYADNLGDVNIVT